VTAQNAILLRAQTLDGRMVEEGGIDAPLPRVDAFRAAWVTWYWNRLGR
jgi:hypothetical protein